MSTENYDENVKDGSLDVPNQESPIDKPELTFGQHFVGLYFNPSGDSKVDKIKRLAAEMVDLLVDDLESQQITMLQKNMLDHTLMQILQAQMMAVKVITFKM
jgi:hypothetical protein